MPPSPSPPRFVPGERVAERPKKRMVLTHNTATKQRIEPFFTQRYGTVVDTVYRMNSRGSHVPYVLVRWDGTQNASAHMQSRLCLERDLAAEAAAYNPT